MYGRYELTVDSGEVTESPDRPMADLHCVMALQQPQYRLERSETDVNQARVWFRQNEGTCGKGHGDSLVKCIPMVQ